MSHAKRIGGIQEKCAKDFEFGFSPKRIGRPKK